MNKHESVELIAKCIHLRDNAMGMHRDELHEAVREIARYNVISCRQIALLTNGAISASSCIRLTKKRSKVGGKLNPVHLEQIREVVFEVDLGRIDWSKILKIISTGTSVEVFVKLSGISRSTLYRKIRNEPLL